MLLKSEKVRNNFCIWATEVLNGLRDMPAYLRYSKLITLSKTSKQEVDIEKTRPILVSSHITKILEKAIVAKLGSLDSSLLKVGDY